MQLRQAFMAVKIFFCYAHEDESLLKKLKTHLIPLQRQGLIETWHDRDISAGAEWEYEISQQLNTAQIILLLVSPDFMASDYCYSTELKRAIERHESGEATVIPVILRPVYWQGTLGKLQALPTDATPVIDSTWHSLDKALLDVTQGILKIVNGYTPQIKRWSDEANAHYEAGRFQEALAAFEEIIKLAPNDANAYQNRGNVLYRIGRIDEASTAFKQAASLDPRRKVFISQMMEELKTANNMKMNFIAQQEYEQAADWRERELEIIAKSLNFAP